jgi:hypothetical protein
VHRITRDEAAIEALETDLLAFAGMVRANEELLRGYAQAAEAADAAVAEAA